MICCNAVPISAADSTRLRLANEVFGRRRWCTKLPGGKGKAGVCEVRASKEEKVKRGKASANVGNVRGNKEKRSGGVREACVSIESRAIFVRS
jgi:hypothetical protein